jgi:predicted kinase
MTHTAKLRLDQINLSELADALDSGPDQETYLDPADGTLYGGFAGEVLDMNGDSVDDPDELGWVWVDASPDASRLGYADMMDFTEACSDLRLRRELLGALEGKGAFRRFRNVIHSQTGETNGRTWGAFSSARWQLRALDWLEEAELVDGAELETERLRLQSKVDEVLTPAGSASTPVLLLLNGLPGIGKSTVAARLVAERPGALRVEADALLDWIGPPAAGELLNRREMTRVLALAMIGAHLEGGRDVVVPQLVAIDLEVARFREVVESVGARFVHVLLDGQPPEARVPADARDDLATYASGLATVGTADDVVHVDAAGAELGAVVAEVARRWAAPVGEGR